MGWRVWGLACGVLLAATASLAAQSDLSCERCHGELEFLRQHAEQLSEARRLLVPTSMLEGTAHDMLRCGACHTGYDRFPHTPEAYSSSCADCHEEAVEVWAEGGHGGIDGEEAVACTECHGVHAVASARALGSGAEMAAMVAECASCHETQRLEASAPHAVEAACYACHSPHEARQPEVAGSGLSPAEQPETCGACHQEVAASWREDAHGRAVAAATEVGEETPTCTACHGSHPVAGQAERQRLEVDRCAGCHEHYAESFSDSYHGQATTLGSTETATCADCHGAHSILGADEPESMVSEARLVETCGTCHPDANKSFVGFQPHADHHDREGNPLLYWAYTFMTGLLVGTMAFFGLHTLLWLIRLGIDRARGVSDHGYPDPTQVPLDSAQRGEGGFVWRFRLYHRVTHAAVVISFFLLVFTGMPLRFSCTPWSGYLMDLLGGVEMAGLLHRIGGAITFGYFGAHLGFLVRGIVRAEDRRRILWGRESIVPHPQDVRDLFAQFRWFLGLGPRPRFGRFSYMEKFDYFAVFWGVAIIGGTGLMLWMPEFFSGFLPGWMFNVATIVHADEAMLATLFIFTIHFFNVHLRPEKFPLDAVMFTGRATVEYMEEEHPEISDRIREHEGEAPSRRQQQDTPAPPPSRRQTLIATIFGFLALGLGLMLIGMMTWASLC
ncbi:MAG: cytochrome c3 family protein [Longimicrobiales bacterium]|nr:cytochrome c3 family protein [Longimicrobiales bacterium]